MVLETNSQGSLYCTFEETDINNYFQMTSKDFMEDQNAISRFSDILIKRAKDETGIDMEGGKELDISIYELNPGSFAISIAKGKRKLVEISSKKKDVDSKYDVVLSDKELNKLMDYVNFLVDGMDGIVGKVNNTYYLLITTTEENVCKLQNLASEFNIGDFEIINEIRKAYIEEHGVLLTTIEVMKKCLN